MNNRKLPAATEYYQYYVVTRSASLNAPAIFLNFEDCSIYIDEKENESSYSNYKAFESLENATNYLSQCMTNRNYNHPTKKRRPTANQDKRSIEFNKAWDTMLTKLQDFKHKYGHCDVPIKSKSLEDEYLPLSRWVRHMRRQIKEFDENQEISLIDSQRIQVLLDMGFNKTIKRVGIKRKRSNEKENMEFDTMIKQLKDHKEKGEAINRNTKLQGWITKQRKEYLQYKESKDSTMTPERIIRLAENGFNFVAKKTLTWNERAIQWLEYKHKHGKDPKRYSADGLGKWCSSQRTKYKLMNEGGRTNLSEEQAKQLTDWGFEWGNKIKVPTNSAPKRPWKFRFEQLKEFQKQNGHCLVPQATPELGHWVHTQRSEYRKYARGQRCAMTKERLQQLNSIGFHFRAGKRGSNYPLIAQKIEISGNESDLSESDNEALLRQFDYGSHG